VNNQGGPVEEDAGDLIWVFLEFASSHDAVKNEGRVGQSTRLKRSRVRRASVWRISSP